MGSAKRIQSIDVLRGIIMVVMALDHVRDYFSSFPFEPTDLQHTTTTLFFTRWITHFCAPIFIFLSGTSAFLSLGKKESKKHAAFRLFTRGLWLVFLELTIIRYGWMFDVDYNMIVVQVIWAIGWSMMFLSVLIFLPLRLILAIGLLMVTCHNMLDSFHPYGGAGIVWQFLHVQSPVDLGNGKTIFIVYPLIPWIGVMALGYCFGTVFRKEEQVRNKTLYLTGGIMMLLFVFLRFLNVYGDPSAWQVQNRNWFTVLSFVNCTKYPPSLLYLLMTIGPAIISLPFLERAKGTIVDIFKVFGWVPFFFYILHIYLIHTLALLAEKLLHAPMITGVFRHPAYSISVVYSLWLVCIVALYLPCRWFMKVKMNNRNWWLSYL